MSLYNCPTDLNLLHSLYVWFYVFLCLLHKCQIVIVTDIYFIYSHLIKSLPCLVSPYQGRFPNESRYKMRKDLPLHNPYPKPLPFLPIIAPQHIHHPLQNKKTSPGSRPNNASAARPPTSTISSPSSKSWCISSCAISSSSIAILRHWSQWYCTWGSSSCSRACW